ncbi:MAG: CDP-diacylglycerol--glycerol-3-phosphate 3-phosphatidyltransferase [Planctomycetota bacterium]
MNIPNTITMARLLLTVVVFLCLQLAPVGLVSASSGGAPSGGAASGAVAQVDATLAWIAFAMFLVAAFSDFLDGYLARKWNMVTAFGRIADPFADKILISGTLIMLLQFSAASTVLTHWYVVVVIAREFLVTAIRGYVESTGQEFGADRLGKWKMVSQCWTVGAVLSMVAGSSMLVWAAHGGFWVSLALTVVSGLNYVLKARKLIVGTGI